MLLIVILFGKSAGDDDLKRCAEHEAVASAQDRIVGPGALKALNIT